jgi:hypothetical protein
MEIERLCALIQEYQSRVQEAVNLFGEHKNMNPLYWRSELLPRRGFIDEAQTLSYYFHGIGCQVELPSGPVDWDWGHEERIDGFDEWRLCQFAEEGTTNFPEFVDKENLEAVFAEAVSQGLIKKLYLQHHDSLYYFTSTE